MGVAVGPASTVIGLVTAALCVAAIACGQPYSQNSAQLLYGRVSYRFAYIRWGNLDMNLPKALNATTLLPSQMERFQILRGRDESERIIVAAECEMESFLASLSVYITQPGATSTWTAVYTPNARSIDALPSFIEWAIVLITRKTVIGKHQILQFTGGVPDEEPMRLLNADLKQLNYFITANRTRMIKDYFISLAISWEKNQVSQRQVWRMVRQIIHQIAVVYQPVCNRLETALQEFNELIRCANSYGELMASTYSMLFDNGNVKDRKLSTQELYDYAIQYIAENYAQPLSMQSVCDEVGISQTYLSRLFRKYGNVTFNAYLTQCRIEAAMRLLRDKPDLKLRDVAACHPTDLEAP